MIMNVGEFCWNELMTSDTKKAQEFYQDVFGWTSKKLDMGKFHIPCSCKGIKLSAVC